MFTLIIDRVFGVGFAGPGSRTYANSRSKQNGKNRGQERGLNLNERRLLPVFGSPLQRLAPATTSRFHCLFLANSNESVSLTSNCYVQMHNFSALSLAFIRHRGGARDAQNPAVHSRGHRWRHVHRLSAL